MEGETVDMASNWWVLSIRYDILTMINIAVWMAFLFCMAVVRGRN